MTTDPTTWRTDATSSTVAGPAPTGIPQAREDRDRILLAVREHAASENLAPPLTFHQLHDHSGRILASAGAAPAFRNWVTVLLNNETWRSRVASVAYSRRLLLLPQCLRDRQNCPGKVDEMGLVCAGCGRCVLHALKSEAEGLGYVALISEGTAVVLSLLQSGQIDAFVGSSCMGVLEKVFPIVSMLAVPAIAIPLLHDGCADTAVDADWIREAVVLTDSPPARG